jgi:hypothetical protein
MSDFGYQGTEQPGSSSGDYNSQAFLIQSLINRVNTSTLVQVVAVTNAGELSPVGFVDVTPLVNQLDGDGRPTPHAVIHHIPYFRLQGGTDAIIIDPKVGDLGIAIFADHDISSVKAAKGQANPGSLRRYDMADGLYIGGVLNGTPAQYIRYYSGGIKVFSPTKISIQSGGDIEMIAGGQITATAVTSITNTAPTIAENASTGIVLNGPVTQGLGSNGGNAHLKGPLTVDGEVTAVTTPLHSHAHTGVTTGGSNTGGPTP